MTQNSSPSHSWVRHLVRLKPARLPWGPSIRAALCVGLPFAIGLVTGSVMTGLWIVMGTFFLATGERKGNWRSNLKQIAISAPIGAAGYFAGYLGHFPLAIIVLAMALVGFVVGILNSYGMTYSTGTMFTLLTASLAIGVPEIGTFWSPALLFLAGALIYAGALGIEALLDSDRTERMLFSDLAKALAKLAKKRTDFFLNPTFSSRSVSTFLEEGPRCVETEEARRLVIDTMAEIYHIVQGTEGQGVRTLRAFDGVFSAIMGETLDSASFRTSSGQLEEIGRALAQRGEMPIFEKSSDDKGLAARIELLGETIRKTRSDELVSSVKSSGRLNALIPDRETLKVSAALALCLAIAYAMRGVVKESHWFWIPLTVGLIMKPDFGSVFARAILRSIGTAGGVILGVILVTFFPKGLGLVVVMSLFAGLLPWAMLKSYALQTLMLTPLVLVLVDFIAPGPKVFDYMGQRLMDTLIGAFIAIVFGYLIWPRTHQKQFTQSFARAAEAVRGYLQTCGNGRDLFEKRHSAYGLLATLRAQLQRSMAEPPPAGREAEEWFLKITASERLCDRITIYAENGGSDIAQVIEADLDRLR